MMSHWDHHRYVNRENDPNVALSTYNMKPRIISCFRIGIDTQELLRDYCRLLCGRSHRRLVCLCGKR